MVEEALWSHVVTLPPAPDSVATARSFVRRRLLEHDLLDLDDEVRLVTSELATNAALHAETPYTVLLEGFPDVVRLTVRDGSRRPPVRTDPPDLATHGRGLGVVAMSSKAWGVHDDPGHAKSVWASFRIGR